MGAFTLAPPKPKGKRKAKPSADALDLAWSTCCQHWQTISGRLPAMTPDAGMGLSLMEAIERDGAAVVVRRFAYLASGPGLWMADKGVKITAVCRSARSEWVKQTDREALDWERARAASEATGAAGGVVGRVESQNRSEPRIPAKHGHGSAWATTWGAELEELARPKRETIDATEIAPVLALEVLDG